MAGSLSQCNQPVWIMVIAPLGTFVVMTIILALILGRSRRKRIGRLPNILKSMNNCLSRLAYRGSKKIAEEDRPQLAKELAELIGATRKQVEALEGKGPVGRRTEKAIWKKVEKTIKKDLPSFFERVTELTEKHGVGLRSLSQRDFRYQFYKCQLDGLRPVPNLDIDDEITKYFSYAVGLNGFLMLQQASLPEIDRRLSQEAALESRRYPTLLERMMNQQLVRINMAIDSYLKERNKND